MPNISFLHFLRDCRLVDHADAPFTRLDTDLAFIKETRMCAHTDALCAVPIPRAPGDSDASHCLPSPVVQHAQRHRVNRTMPVAAPVHRFAATVTASGARVPGVG